MKKIILSCISVCLFAVSCSLEQDPLASFPEEIRQGILPGDNRVLKPIPRGAIRVESAPVSPLVFHEEKAQIGINVRLLQSFQAPYVIEILNLDSLPGKASFNQKTQKINWVPDLSKLKNLFEYIPIHIRVNFKEPKPLYVEHVIHVRAYRTFQGIKVQSVVEEEGVAGGRLPLVVRITVKDLDTEINFIKGKPKPPRLMITQGSTSHKDTRYLLPYLKVLPYPRLKSYRDQSVWIIEAHFDIKNLKLSQDTTFLLNYEVFSSVGKTSGLRSRAILIQKNFVPLPPKSAMPTSSAKSPKSATPTSSAKSPKSATPTSSAKSPKKGKKAKSPQNNKKKGVK